MSSDYFVFFAVVASMCWGIGAIAALRKKNTALPIGFSLAGTVVFMSYITALWITLERPPMRTMGETRLWYSLFLSLVALITYARWKYSWILSFSYILTLVYICLNLLNPEINDRTMMPVLQSIWFVPHVIMYMFAYSLLGAAAVMAVYLLMIKKMPINEQEMALCDNLVYIGIAFMTLGLLLGAIWAKDAWGHYWAWDPKETWAAATWFCYLIYIHLRITSPSSHRYALIVLLTSFAMLQMCWYGVNYLPSAKGVSAHTYNIEE